MPLSVHLSPAVTGAIPSHRRKTCMLRSPTTTSRRFSSNHPEIRYSTIAAATRMLRKAPHLVAKAIEQSRDTTESEAESDSPAAEGAGNMEEEQSLIGAEIKAAMEQRKSAAAEEERGKSELLSGVAEEVREIEWPAFQKVLGTTGVVLGVIAGSSVVLLTVNFILAELSDRVFAGKGVQDFFS
ncbi:PREDICTED: preprotein translocase subunit SECE1-like [Tarenaya hassleriana]|uniref:preprotein translocase subunit SECE1-like n=1 Tax=Tarenaya hassleriana TaxID=28532 RepID=UPI00053C6EEB|nr:PREDICTED: preprotein translocase subunit SECE1-like [Tarenaya hassleriana]